MSEAMELVQMALKAGMEIPLKEGRFPYFADALYRAGVLSNTWYLPSGDSLYVTRKGLVNVTGEPLAVRSTKPAPFNERALYLAIQEDRRGNITFRDFLRAIWAAGVVSYTVDFVLRTVTYYGVEGDACKEHYPSVVQYIKKSVS
ncbi:TPA: DUF1398 family protein [Serratia marcescens]|jgi:uncharacterized protein YbcV (DUF1398 family)|uniref:DUF1398 family protein n=1 Tax=Serratia TaxID=613 RepID=UPI0009A4C142|nr:DUF1398 family protein [Serratia marcescens]OPJ99667.1 hypothetical protein B1R44_00335 [Serratia marcescens]HEJ0405235.1 DUF1398 family protein [Serratia marcescens]HEJ7314365.1 DUF1398 family protein [Serratia marcescens]